MKLLKTTLFFILASILCSCKSDTFRAEEGIVWNTSYHITYQSSLPLTDYILSVMQQVDAQLSPFNEKSMLSRLNSSTAVRGSRMLNDVVKGARDVYHSTGGYFDPSAAPLINAYGFGAKTGRLPDSAAIAEMKEYIGFDKLLQRGDSLVKSDPRMEFNFSAIAKGYGCDCVADMFRSKGVENFMVEIGGEVVVAGSSPRGGKWRISVDRPIETAGVIHDSQLVVELDDCAIATSGNYRNFRESGGQKIGHILNPLTGLPADGETVSATIVAPDCMTADAYATACMAMPRSEAIALIGKLQLSALLIFKDGTVWMSPGFKKLVAE